MGKTVRMSQRKSKSPYASRARRRATQPQLNVPAAPADRVEILYQRDQPDSVVSQSDHASSSGVSGSQLQQVAASVTAQIVPEIRNEIIQTVNSLRNSPSAVESPDSLNNAVNPGINLSNSSSVSPVLSVNDNLGINVSQQLRDKISNGEYLDLSSLLSNSTTEQPSPLAVNSNGQLILQTKQNKKISDINTWIDAFLIYTSIYTATHPECIQEILKYIYIVKLGASRSAGLGWREYDQQFRLKKARYPALSWGKVDPELWLLYIHSPQSMSHNGQLTVGTGQSNPNTGTGLSNMTCYEYNNKGRCPLPYCRYIHKCIRCNGPHPAINCRIPLLRNPGISPMNFNGSKRGSFRTWDRTNVRNVSRETDASRQLPFIRSPQVGKVTH